MSSLMKEQYDEYIKIKSAEDYALYCAQHYYEEQLEKIDANIDLFYQRILFCKIVI